MLILQNYKPLFFLFCVTVFIALLLIIVNLILTWVVQKQIKNDDKLSAYECGFEPFEVARLQFNVHYYLVGILFLIFDVEIIFLIPWSFIYLELPLDGHLVFWFFIGILTLGFIYEWRKGALKW